VDTVWHRSYSGYTWWFIIARRHSIHKCTSSFASPKFILECDEEYIDRRFFNRTDWCGFRVPPWRSIASEALCFSEPRLFASSKEELLALLSFCIKLQIQININIITISGQHTMNICINTPGTVSIQDIFYFQNTPEVTFVQHIIPFS